MKFMSDKTEKTKKTLVLIDSNAVIHRAFHALPPLTKKDGTPTGVVYGYALTLLSVMEQLKPGYIAATFDLPGLTFRHEAFKEYKATRVKAPDELYAQIPFVKEMLKAYNIPIYEKKGFEADDIIGTLTKDSSLEKKVDTIIVTGDLDTLQLIDEDTKVFTLRRGIKDTVLYDEKMVRERYGLGPEQIIDLKALRGDPSDNIPGVKGIGEKTATELLKKYKTLENVFKKIDKIEPESLRKKLQDGEKDARMSFDLAKIVTNVPVDFELEDTQVSNFDPERLAEFFKQMEFFSLYKRVSGKRAISEKRFASAGQADNRQQENKKEVKIKIIKSESELDKINSEIGKNKFFAYTVLASSEKYFDATLSGIGISINEKIAYFVPAELVGSLKKVFENKDIQKIGFNIKFDLEMFWKLWHGAENNEQLVNSLYGNAIELCDNFFDVQLAAYLLGLNGAKNLEKLIFEEFGAELAYAPTKNGQANLLDDNSENEQKCAAEKAAWFLRLRGEYRKRISEVSRQQASGSGNKKTLKRLFEKYEMPIAKILAKMEIAGVLVETGSLKKASQTAEKEIGKLEKEIYAYAKEEFNINSPNQLASILYEKLSISTTEIRRGKTGFSTDADQLRKIHDLHPIIPLIESYRELFKIKTTYADALPQLVHNDGRIHADFNQAVTATGRLSSSEPNMQNIPKRGQLADLIRKAFIAPKSSTLVSADYSQIDLRVAAHLSNDPKLVEIFKQGKDVHRATAAWVNNVSENEISDRQRFEAKSLNFGILYGMGIYGFMRDSGVSRKRAKQFMEQYMMTFSKLKEFIEKTKLFAGKNGFVETELGRRRYIPSIQAGNAQVRAAAERMAVNLPVQGLAADIMKLAMVEVEELLKKYNRKEIVAKLILQIHDELIFEVKLGLENKFMKDVKKVMESVYELRVPLTVDVSSGSNWMQL